MIQLLTLIGSMVLASCSLSSSDALAVRDCDQGQCSSWERQEETYRSKNYDTYRNGPLPQTVEEERRRQERRDYEQRQAQEQERQRQQRQQSQQRGY